MSSPRTPAQIHDAVGASMKQLRKDYGKFVKDYVDPALAPLSIQAMSNYERDAAIVKQVAAVDANHLATISLLARLEQDTQLAENLASLEDGIDRLDVRLPANSQIVNMVRRLAASDSALALELSRVVRKVSIDSNKKVDKFRDELVKLLEDCDIANKVILIEEAKDQIKRADELSQTHKVALEAQNQLIGHLTVKSMDLEIELQSRPKLSEIRGEDEDEEIAIRQFMAENLGIESQDFPTKWSELDAILQSQTEATSQEFRQKLAECEALMKLAEKNREMAVGHLQREQNLHHETKSSLKRCRERNQDLNDKLHSLKTEEDLLKERLDKCDQDKTKFIDDALDKAVDLSLKEEQVRRHEETITKLKENIQTMDDTIAQLRQETSDLKIARATEAAERGGNVALWTEKYNTEVNNLRRCEDAGRRRELHIAGLNDQLSRVQETNNTLLSQVDRAEQRRDDCLGRVQTLEDDLRSKDEAILAHTQNITELRADLNAKQDDLAAKSNRISALEAHKEKFEDRLHAREAECENQKLNLQKLADDALHQEVERSKAVQVQHKQDIENLHQSHQSKLDEKNQETARLENRIDQLETSETDLVVKLQSQTTAHDSMKVSRDNKNEEVISLQQKLAVAQTEQDHQSQIIEELRLQVQGNTVVSQELNLARTQIANHKLNLERVEAKSSKLLSNSDDLRRIFMRWGFGGNDEEIDLTIVDKLKALPSISQANLDEHCEVWKTAILSEATTPERVTAIELWMQSIIAPSKMSMATVNGFVRSKPTPAQLPFLDVAISNVIAHTSKLDFQQAAFVLRGLELLWMATPIGRLQPLQKTLISLKDRLPTSPLISGLSAWLTLAIGSGSQGTRGEQIIRSAKDKVLPLNDDASLIVDDLIVGEQMILIQRDLIVLADKKRLHRVFEVDDWVVWVEGFPRVGGELKTKFSFGVENLELIGKTIG